MPPAARRACAGALRVATALVTAALASIPTTAGADGPGAVQVSIDSSTAASVRQFRSAGLGTVDQRAIAQRLKFSARSDDGRVDGVARVGYRFDPGLPRDPADPRLAELQLEPELDQARVAVRPVSDLTLRVGRLLDFGPLGPARVDGAALSWAPERGAVIDAMVGVRADSASARIDPAWLDPLAPRDERADEGRRSALAELRAGWRERAAAASVGYRVERAVGADRLYDRRVHAALRLGRLDRAHASADARWAVLYRRIDRAALVGRLPLGGGTSVDADARWTHVAFPLDSPFAVYASDPSLRWSLNARHALDDGFVLRAGASLRSLPSPDHIPLAGGIDRRRAGLDLGFDSADAWSDWRASARLSGETERDASALSARGTLAHDLRRGPALHGSLYLSALRDTRAALAPDRAVGLLSLGVRAIAGRRAAIDVVSTGGWDTWHRARIDLFALVDVALPGRL